MLTVHHLENSRSLRLLWLLEEMGVEYDLKIYQRDPKTNLAPADYQALHPMGKSPVVTDGEMTLAETGAIVEYLLDHYMTAGLRPEKGTPERQAYYYWMHAAEGSVMPLLTLGLFLTMMETRPPFFMRPIIKAVTGQLRKAYHTPSLRKQINYINTHLGENEWFTGSHLTGADAMMLFPLEAAMVRTVPDADYSHIKAYLDRVYARPAYQRAVERGGKQDLSM